MHPSAAGSPLLRASGISKSFGALRVLDGVSLEIARGEAVGIVGPNGAGKTTLLGALVGAMPISAGTIEFAGQPVTRLPAAERTRRGIVRTHQIPRPFTGMTVFENVLVAASNAGGLRGETARDRALDSLSRTGMLPTANRRADTLGLLDRKRLELARAVATGPTLLLLDEIGGGLTDAEAAELVSIIRSLLADGIAIVWIEHIVHVLLQVVSRLVCMDAGRIIRDGEPRTVLSDPAVVEAYLGGVPA